VSHKVSLIAFSCVLALGLGACTKKESATAPGATPVAAAPSVEVVKIGSVAPLTGPQAHLGKDNENGARMAIDEINASGVTIGGKKVQFKLVSEDDQTDPKAATIVAQKLVDEQVHGVIGHLNSGTTIPASKIYSDAGIPQISPSATAVAYTAQGFKTSFRVMTNDAQQGKVLGNFAVNALKAKKIAVIDDRTAYGQGLADEMVKSAEAAGAKVVVREFTTDHSTDFMSILTSIKGKNPDVIFFGGMEPQAAPMVKQMRGLGIKAAFLGGDGIQMAEFVQIAGADGEGVYASSPGRPLAQMAGGPAFEAKFTAKYGKIQNYAPYAYDAARVMVEAMKKADSTLPAKYLPVMASMEFTGVTGPIAFDEKGDIKGGAVTMYRVQNGAWTPVP